MEAIKNSLNLCTGKGLNPWTVTIIDYYGPGCTLDNGSMDQIAILPQKTRIDYKTKFELKFVNLNNVALEFAKKNFSVTLIFNHSSTKKITLNEFRKLQEKEEVYDWEDRDNKLKFYA